MINYNIKEEETEIGKTMAEITEKVREEYEKQISNIITKLTGVTEEEVRGYREYDLRRLNIKKLGMNSY